MDAIAFFIKNVCAVKNLFVIDDVKLPAQCTLLQMKGLTCIKFGVNGSCWGEW